MPIWHDSFSLPVIFQPIPRKKATAIWNKARRLDMKTSRKGRHGGMVGRSALTVLSVLIFDFLDYASGRLDPSHAAIARKARMCVRTVQNALNRLRSLGILNWMALVGFRGDGAHHLTRAAIRALSRAFPRRRA